jgi:hypothetical protein
MNILVIFFICAKFWIGGVDSAVSKEWKEELFGEGNIICHQFETNLLNLSLICQIHSRTEC